MPRINWIDVARGIGIILVIQGHALGADSYRHFIYAFHMPLFFFLSGLVFNYKKYSLSVTFKKSVKGILVPYVLFAILFYVIWWLQNAHFRFELFAFVKHMQGIIYANSNNLFFNLVLWFLPCLFISKIAFAVLSSRLKSINWIILVLVTSSLLGYLSFVFLPNLTLPFGIESAFTAIVFFAMGSILKTNYFEKINLIPKSKITFILITALVICLVAGFINFQLYGVQIDLRLNNLGNYFVFYIGAVSGIILTITISILINKNHMLEYIGKYSLALFVFHNLIFYYLTNIVLLFIEKRTLWEIKDYYLSYFYTVFAIVIILAFVFIYRKIKPSELKI